MDDNMLLVEREGYVVTLTINRPQARNSLHPSLLKQMTAVLKDLARAGETRCVIIRGAGDKAFSAGYDISSNTAAEQKNANDFQKSSEILMAAMSAIVEFPFPVIAMVRGFCMGAGLGLATTCDIRVAAEDARFAITPAKLGVLYNAAGVQRVINLVGVGWTKYLFCVGRQVNAQRAREIGLVEEVVPVDELESFTNTLAQEIANNAPLSVSGGKLTVNILQNYQQLTMNDIDALQALVDRCSDSQDRQEGMRAFAEKRKAVFQGS